MTSGSVDPNLDRLIVRVIGEHVTEHGYGPSIQEIARMTGAALSVVHHHVHVLRAAGVLLGAPQATHTLRIAPRPPEPGFCHRPGCVRPASEKWCSPSCRAIGGHVKRWVEALEAEHLLRDLRLPA